MSRRERQLRRLSRSVVPVAVVAAVILFWQLAAMQSSSPFIVTPVEVFHRLREMYFAGPGWRLWIGGDGWPDVLASVRRAALGWGLAVIVGVVGGLAIGRLPHLEAATAPVISLARSLPVPALIGVAFFLFGTGDLPKILLIAFGAVWPVLFNSIDGARSLGMTRLEVTRVYRIPFLQWCWRILLMGALPKIFAGLRTSLSYSLILMIISELQRSVNGIGYQLNQVQRGFDYPALWSLLVVLAILGFVSNSLLLAVQHRVLAWHEEAHS